MMVLFQWLKDEAVGVILIVIIIVVLVVVIID